LKGIYSLYCEAYWHAAEAVAKRRRDVMLREMQSTAWEALRGLWGAPDEKQDPADERANGIWQRYHEGKLDLAAAQRQILARGINLNRRAVGEVHHAACLCFFSFFTRCF
jgi:hypothetical protein